MDPKAVDTMLMKLSLNPISGDYVIPPAACVPICLDQVAQSKLLQEMPTLDDIDITVRQVGYQSRGMHIPCADAAGDQQRGAGASSGSGKGKEQVPRSRSSAKSGSQSPPRNVGASSTSAAGPEMRRRLYHDDVSVVGDPPLAV
jgi:hypothetical protein